MKKIITVTGIFFVLIGTGAFAQNVKRPKMSVIAPYRLEIAYFKTSNLVFPYPIKSVDRGSKDVLVQKAKGFENILQVKAGKQCFEETNLTVITADGHLYSCILNYAERPNALNIRFVAPSRANTGALFSPGTVNEAKMQAGAIKVMGRMGKKRTVRGIKDKKHGMKLSLNGLFVLGEIMYLKIRLENRSSIDYGIGQLRFIVRDRETAKRTAAQELEVRPLHVYGDATTVGGHTEHAFVFALPKFTFPDKKHLSVQLMEKSGGRHLELKISNRAIVRSKALSTER